MAGETVLIVEDNEKNMKLVRDVLQFNGYKTLEAETGARAIELAMENPDLILMDMQLPDMDGTSVAAAIRELDGGTTMPIVALTAFAMTGDRERFLAAGFDAYMSKPIDVRTFADEIKTLCTDHSRPSDRED